MSKESKVTTYNAELDLNAIPKRFNYTNPNSVCAKDVIAYVRDNICFDPWCTVILKHTGKRELKFSYAELLDNCIYIEGVTEIPNTNILSLGNKVYFIVKESDLDISLEDCGINKITEMFSQKYNVMQFSVLYITDNCNSEMTVKLCEYTLNSGKTNIIFPYSVKYKNIKLPNGLDIWEYVREIEIMRDKFQFNAVKLTDILQELDKQIKPHVTAVQNLHLERTSDVSLLTTYLTLKYYLSPLVPISFADEYLRYKFCYPYGKLSLYERLQFLAKLPKVVGYIGNHRDFNCLAKVISKIYPAPHYVFNLDKMCLEDENNFDLSDKANRFIDFRKSFKESVNPIIVGGSNIVAKDSTDKKTDLQLIKLFKTLTNLVKKEEIFISVKNSIFMIKNGVRYLLYCPEEIGLEVEFYSNYFGSMVDVIRERDFHHLLDAQFENVLLRREKLNTKLSQNALISFWDDFDESKVLKPAIPLEVSLYMQILSSTQNGLSYYDRALRCGINVLPLVTTKDSEIYDVNPLFKELNLGQLRDDSQAGQCLTSFGTIPKLDLEITKFPVTFRVFQGGNII